MCTAMTELLPKKQYEPAEYNPAARKTVEHPSTREDLAEFIEEYLYSDVSELCSKLFAYTLTVQQNIGLIASAWLTTADRSTLGIVDPDCLRLAELHSDATDYPKTGMPVAMQDLPRNRQPDRPDWSAPELSDRTGARYYESMRYIGRLYREVKLDNPRVQVDVKSEDTGRLTLPAILVTFSGESFAPKDRIERAIHRHVSRFTRTDVFEAPAQRRATELWKTFSTYRQTLRQISLSFNIAHKRSTVLKEEEIVAGTIVAVSSQPRMRQESVSEMREKASILVNRTAAQIAGPKEEDLEESLKRAWLAYRISTLRPEQFGFRSFGLVAMHEIFSAVKAIEAMESLLEL